MGRGRAGGFLGAAAVVVALAAPSCSAPGKGAIILAVSTDMQTPKDIDVVSVFVATDGAAKFDYLGRVSPDGTLTLPSTLAIVEPDDPSAQVRIRVIAFKTQPSGDASARVVRDVVTTVPHQLTALLRLPLNFLDDGSAQGTLPALLVPDATRGVPEGSTSYLPTTTAPTDPGYIRTTCDYGQGKTSIAGICKDVAVQSSTLAPYADSAVFGAGGSASNPACFRVDACFAQASPVAASSITTAADGSCAFPLTPGESGKDWNCALATTDGTGTCTGGKCFVPLESDPGEGFAVQPGKSVLMVPGVCKKLAAGATLYLDKTSCKAKVEASPVCQPTTGSAVDGGSTGVDATVGGDATVPFDGAACTAVGGACTSGAQCCTGSCPKGACASLALDAQAPPADGGCAALGGANGGLPAGCPCGATGGDAGPDGGVPACGGPCASKLCGPDDTGQLVCQSVSGCHPAGDSCTTDSDCCGSAAMPDASAQPSTCVSGVCTASVGCKPNGDLCKLATTSCNSSCNCCSGNCTTMATCRVDNVGVPRCTNATCVGAGQACASSADCCNAAPCVPNASGNPLNVCFSASCVPSGGPCSDTADCCVGSSCTNHLCATTSTTCALYGQSCASATCCNGVPCAAGACVYTTP